MCVVEKFCSAISAPLLVVEEPCVGVKVFRTYICIQSAKEINKNWLSVLQSGLFGSCASSILFISLFLSFPAEKI
jgi:hypothetical protein